LACFGLFGLFGVFGLFVLFVWGHSLSFGGSGSFPF
jgi:hypothetical protein